MTYNQKSSLPQIYNLKSPAETRGFAKRRLKARILTFDNQFVAEHLAHFKGGLKCRLRVIELCHFNASFQTFR